MQTIIDSNTDDREWTLVEKIRVQLIKFGITDFGKLVIDKEAEQMLYDILTRDDINKVTLDDEGGLDIEYLENDPNGEEIKDNYNGTISS